MALRKDTLATKRRILSVCVRLFLQQGYHATPISQITAEANVSVGTFQNIFHTTSSSASCSAASLPPPAA